MSWQDDKRWADAYVSRIKETLGRELIVESSADEDQKHATDFKVLVVKPYRFAYRLREHRYLEKYAHDFTIRSRRASGTPTEYHKILKEKVVDFYFFAFSAPEGADLAAWVIIDMNRFRDLYDPDLFEIMEKPNRDGRSHFMAYQVSSLPRAVIKAASDGYFDPKPKCLCIRCAVARGEID